MKSGKISITKSNIKVKKTNKNNNDNYQFYKFLYIFISNKFIIIINLLCLFFIYRYQFTFINYNNKNYIDCSQIGRKLYNRTGPFEFEVEFLFISKLIECNISISLIRFGDGENLIMKGNDLKVVLDKWHWHSKNKNFQKSLIESSSICVNNNNFIGIPCKNWFKISESILSFSNCTNSKYMTYATVFINKNYILFKDWILRFINSPNRRKIILVANSFINKSISWAEKYFPVPDHLVENWDTDGESLLSKLSEQAKINTTKIQIFLIFITLKIIFLK